SSSPELMLTVIDAECATLGRTFKDKQTKHTTIVFAKPTVPSPMLKFNPRATLNLILTIFMIPPITAAWPRIVALRIHFCRLELSAPPNPERDIDQYCVQAL